MGPHRSRILLLFSSILLLLLAIQRPASAKLAPSGGGPGGSMVCKKADADKITFKISMKEFLKRRKAKNPAGCNWESVRQSPTCKLTNA
jgi:hypothetical protein